MKTYSEKLKDPKWQRKRLEVMERDDFKCRDCSKGDETLHVHHCFYEKGDPWDTDSRFLLTLCGDCHELRQEGEDKARRTLGIAFALSDGDAGWSISSILSDILEAKAGGFRAEIRVRRVEKAK